MAVYRELPGSPVEHFTAEDINCTRRVQCAWDERYTVYQQLWDTVYPFHSYPNLLCRDINIEPFESKVLEYTPGDPSIASHDEAILTCNYALVQGESRDPSDPNNPTKMTFFEEAWEESQEMLTLSGRKYWWDDGNDPRGRVEEMDYPAYLLSAADWKLVYYNVQVLPDMGQYFGKVNDVSVTSPTLMKTFEPETLLFHPWSMSRAVATDGSSEGWTVNLRLSYKPQTWNKFYNPKASSGNEWQQMMFRSGVSYIGKIFYEPYDFTGILPPPEPPP